MGRTIFQGDTVVHDGEKWHVQDVDRISMLLKLAQFDDYGVSKNSKWVRDETCEPVANGPEQPKPVAACEWALDDPDYGVWVTGCGEAHAISEGSPEQNSMKFCCYCGGNLVEPIPTGAGE